MLRSASLVLTFLAVGCAAKTVPPAVTIAPLPAAPQASVAAPEPEPPKVPANYVRMTVAGVVPESQGAAVALLDPTEATVVPIYVGGTEAMSIQQRFEHTAYVRPLTHDLFDATLREIGAKVVRAQVDKLEDGTYFGTLVLKTRSRYIQLDSRPSDAIALALGNDAPIYCAADVVATAGVPRDGFDGLDAPTAAAVSPAPTGSKGGSATPTECLLARALKQAHRPEWKQAAAQCKARGGTP
ncbi:MAG TPA: bifunctional nuclease family protein [Polyangiaceae bacterium]|nr:bifunctional nuclease family protein [Polyangiaceae bacterium]